MLLLGAASGLLANTTREIVGDGKEFNRLPVSWKASDEDKAKAGKAWEIIFEWQKDGVKDGRKLNVVYVAIKNRPPLKDYKGRIERIVKNVQAYYADQMKENGFPPLTFPLDLDKDGKLVVHDAYLDRELDSMDTHSSGPLTWEVAREALLKAGIDASKEYVLIVAQMPDKKGPYYGGGNFESGRCWICDAEHLDPLNFQSTEKGNYLFGSVAADNTVYIGGTAHELGHCFSLPHTKNLTPNEESGASLMGNGNYSYGKELRGEGKGAFLIQSDALRLASIPLFNGKFKPAEGAASVEYTDFKAVPIKDGFEISGKIAGNPPVYGLVAYFDPMGRGDYDSSTTTCIPGKDGTFHLKIVRPGYRGGFDLRLVVLHANGATSTVSSTMRAGNEGVDVSPLIADRVLEKVKNAWLRRDWKQAGEELEKTRRENANDAALLPIFSIWEKAVLPPSGFDSGETPSAVAASISKASLVDLKPEQARSGWWVPLRDVLAPNEGGPKPFLKTGIPERLLYTHAPGVFAYDFGGKWKNLDTVLGIPASAPGKVVFRIMGDGKLLFESPVLDGGDAVPVHLDVSGVRALSIEVVPDPSKSDNGGCWGVIADPVLSR